MRPWSFALRLLLALVLLANGTTAAFANVQMALGDATTGSAAVSHGDERPCHDAAAMQPGVADHGTTPPASPDECCTSGNCLSHCLAHAPAIPAVHAIAWANPATVAPVTTRFVSRASPALQHPIRPPIG